MKPTTPLGALAAALHRDAYDHPTPCTLPECRLAWSQDVDLAERLLENLDALDWEPPRPRLSLPDSATPGKRETSRKAAASIAGLRGGMKGVFELVACNGSHGLTDDEIAAQYDGFAERNGFARLAADSPRKRRMDLAEAGYLIDSGRTRPTRCGREAVVWVARSESAVAA